MKDVIPTAIFDTIRAHLKSGCAHAERGWEAGQEEEDTLTGDLGASLRHGWTRQKNAGGKSWRWRLSYSKFRGRGPDATEKTIGADGIIQIEVEDVTDKTIETKGLLFQAKKQNARSSADLPQQARKMESLIKGGSAVFEYGPTGYRGFDAEEVVYVDGNLAAVRRERISRLGDYLADRFLPCESGVRGLYYEATRKTLFVPRPVEGFVRYRRLLRHRFRIEVQARSFASTPSRGHA